MDNLFRLEVDTGSGVYGFFVEANKLFKEIEKCFGEELGKEIEKWSLASKMGDQFHKYGMYVINFGKWK